MMVVLQILGCLGGTIYLVKCMIEFVKFIIFALNRIALYKRAYDDKCNAETKEQIGFKQDKKEELKRIDLKPNVEDYSRYWKLWESEPVDDEFIDDENFEEEDKDEYPLLHVER